jgi:hypothetical protein
LRFLNNALFITLKTQFSNETASALALAVSFSSSLHTLLVPFMSCWVNPIQEGSREEYRRHKRLSCELIGF